MTTTKKIPESAVKISKGKPRGKSFAKGVSGNAAGRPPGALGKSNVLVRQKLEEHVEAIVDALIARATETVINEDGTVKHVGSTAAQAICMAILCPAPKHPPRDPYPIGSLDTLADCLTEARRLAYAVAAGEVDADHSDAIAKRITAVAELIEIADIEPRIFALERAYRLKTTNGAAPALLNAVTQP